MGEGFLVFEDADGAPQEVGAALLRNYLQEQEQTLRLVLLNACLGALPASDADPLSSLAATLVRGGVPAVVAMQFELYDDAAADLAEVLYDELVAGRPVDRALQQARLHLQGQHGGRLDWLVPVLFMRSTDGQLFVSATASPAVPPVAPTPPAATPPPGIPPAALGPLWQQALSAALTRRWAEAVPLLEAVAAQDPAYRNVGARLAEARQQLGYQQLYADITTLREADDYEAVLAALGELAHQAPALRDEAGHRVWAEGRQRREQRYSAALDAGDSGNWGAALEALDVLIAEAPDDAEALALQAHAQAEVAAERQRQEAEQQRQERAAQERAQRERYGAIDDHLRAERFGPALDALQTLLEGKADDRTAVERVAALIERPGIALPERLRAGAMAGRYGDPRPGVTTLPPAWCAVPAGAFLLGSTNADKQALRYEKPQRTVTLHAFRIARYPITNAQWQQFVDAGGYGDQRWWSEAGWQAREQEQWAEPRFWNDPRFNSANQPVVGVSWYEASAYCRWLTAQGHAAGWLPTSEQIRLPSEAEWEKAARGTDGRIYPWGNEWDAAKANTSEGGIGTTSPVGCYPDGASPCGALDTSGNVWEWTATPWTDDYTKIEGTGIELSNGDRFVLRGGSWADDLRRARCACRYYDLPSFRDNYLGLRVAAALMLEERK